MALILISVQDTPEGPSVSIVAEPLHSPAVGGQLTPAEQIADAMLRVLPTPEPQPAVYAPPTKLIVPN